MKMIKKIWDKIKPTVKRFLQYVISFSVPAVGLFLPAVIAIVYYNGWMLLLYLVTIPLIATQRSYIREKGYEYEDFWRWLVSSL